MPNNTDTSKTFMSPPTTAIPLASSTPLPLAFQPPVTNAAFTPVGSAPLFNNNLQNPTTGDGTTSAFANNAGSVDNTTLAFTPNILDYYDSYTYHWKLFIVPTASANSGNVLDTSIQTIIAESGVTDITIDKVEINSIATPSIECGTGTATTLKFEIVEPSGAGLIDQIYYQSIAMGIGSWLVTPYYIQLQFRGRDPDTENSIVSGGVSGIGALNWVWPIKLTNSKINVTQVGTRYEFEAIFYNEVAQTNSSFSLLNQTTLKQLTNFGSAMAALQTKLNQDCYEKLIDNYSIPDSYTIVVENSLATIPLMTANSKQSTARGSDYVDFSKKTASFTAGTSIDSIVNSLLGSTDYFQESIQGSNAPAANPNSNTAEHQQMKKLWRIVTETRPIAFDALRQDNALAYTIYIFKYDIGVLDADSTQSSSTNVAQQKRVQEYMSKKILRKRYNYLFTGLNDQIKNLDLNLNYSFAAAVSRFGGVYSDSATSSIGVNQQNNQANEAKAGQILRDALDKINNPQPGDNVNNTIANAQQAIADAKVSEATALRYNTLLQYSTNQSALTADLQSTNQFSSGGLSGSGRIGPYDAKGNYIGQQAGSLATAVTSSSGNLSFISNVNINSPEAQNAVKIANAVSTGKLRPVPYKEAIQENNFNGFDNSSDAGRARTSSMFATALYSGLDASLMKIKLTIKGDPYWIFPRNTSSGSNPLNYLSIPGVDQQEAIQSLKTAQAYSESSVNLYGTDNFIIIRMRTPRIYNDTTGSTDPYTDVDTFSGVYKVITILNKFANGVFTQEIDAILDPVINLADIREFIKTIEDSSKQLEPVTPPIISNISPTSIKTQRIMPSPTTVTKPGQDNTNTNPTTSVTNAYGKTTNTATSNVPYDTSNTSGNLFLPEGP